MKKSIQQIIIVAMLTLILSSCRKLIEIDAPIGQLTTENVFKTNESANSAITGLYSSIQSKILIPYKLSLYTGLASDELTNYSTVLGIRQLYTNSVNKVDGLSNDIWNTVYNYIYQSNAIIEGCEKSQDLSSDIKRQLTGEALFMRAFWHFYLVNLYGDVPLVLNANYLISSVLPKSPASIIYKQIIADLEIAQNNLSPNYLGADGVTPTSERVRPNSFAAIALLARAYLYIGEYKNAEQAATILLSNKSTYDTVSLNRVFLKNSSEAIWQLQMPAPTSNRNTHEGYSYILTAKPLSGSDTYCSTISESLLASFETGDQRKAIWIGKFTDQTATPKVDYYYPYKYKVQTSTTISEYSTILRLGEVYLIRSEARAQQDLLSDAIDDIDVIRKRAGLSSIKEKKPTISKSDLLSLILQERRVELFTEWGHRWFDLKRTGKIDERMKIITPTKGGVWDLNFQYWPVPQKDIDNNHNIEQNKGY